MCKINQLNCEDILPSNAQPIEHDALTPLSPEDWPTELAVNRPSLRYVSFRFRAWYAEELPGEWSIVVRDRFNRTFKKIVYSGALKVGIAQKPQASPPV
jgi:hypothetical protein